MDDLGPLWSLGEFLSMRGKIRPFDIVTGRKLRKSPANPKLKQLRPFVFDRPILFTGSIAGLRSLTVEDDDPMLRMDLPFESVWIESTDESFLDLLITEAPDGILANFTTFGLALAEYDDVYRVEGFGVIRTFETHGRTMTLMRQLQEQADAGTTEPPIELMEELRSTRPTDQFKTIIAARLDADAVQTSAPARQIASFARRVFESFRSKGVATGTTRVGQKFRTRGPKGTPSSVTVDELIYVVPRERQGDYATFGEQIEWSHRWEVMGHWRRVKGIGKDRKGRRCVKGSTWVTPHSRGAPDQPVIPKTRVALNPASTIANTASVHPAMHAIDDE